VKEKIINIVVIFFTIIILIVIALPFINPKFSIISDIKDYSASVLAFLTFIYVLLTFYILKSNNKAFKEQLRPYVTVTFPIKYNKLYLSIKNVGRRPAKNVSIEINPDIATIQQENLKGNCTSILNQTFIAPDQEFCNLIDLVPSIILRNKSEKKFKIILKYSDTFGMKYCEDCMIDLSSYLYKDIILNKNISDHLSELNSNLKDILNTLINNKWTDKTR
jgi:hypothetical protein